LLLLKLFYSFVANNYISLTQKHNKMKRISSLLIALALIGFVAMNACKGKTEVEEEGKEEMKTEEVAEKGGEEMEAEEADTAAVEMEAEEAEEAEEMEADTASKE
jgi:outer membrane biosynthesis protein TonB